MTTQRHFFVLIILGLLPLTVAAVGHSLHMGGRLLAIVVMIVGVIGIGTAVCLAERWAR